MTKKSPKLWGCASCPWGQNKETNFVPPEIPENPNLIVVLETTERPKILQRIWDKYGIRPLILGAVNCCSKKDPGIEEIKACRDAYVRPILAQYPGVPVVAYGALAASSLLGGNRKLQNLLYDAMHIDGRLVLFTHHPEVYLRTRQQSVFQHIEVTTACAVRDNLVYPSMTADWKEGLDWIFSSDEIILDVETENPPPPVLEPGEKPKKQSKLTYPWLGGKLAWIGLRANGKSYTWNVYDQYDSYLMCELNRRFAEYEGTIIGHNVKGDLIFLGYYNIWAPKARLWDTLIWLKSQMVWSKEGNGLKWVAKKYWQAPAYEAEVHSLWEQKVPTSQIDYEKMRNYLAGDLWYTECEVLRQAQQPLTYAFRLSMDYLPAITDMEMNGFHVNTGIVVEEVAKNVEEQKYVREEIDTIAKTMGFNEFNPQSSQQILKLLGSVGIRLNTTDADTLEQNAHRHPLLEKLSKLRKLVKKKSTYWDTFLKWGTYDAGDGGVHAQYGVQGTEGGRLNCRNPNMQNPPESVRHCFVSRYPGGRLLDPDLASLEYRLIAHASQDPTLCRMFQQAGFSTKKDINDIHIAAAMTVYTILVEDALVRRSDGKTVNYLGVYGGGYGKFLEASGLPDDENSQAIYKKIKNLYPGIDKWKETLIRRLHNTKRVKNMFGRVREFEGTIGQDIEREAINWAIQSAGHDILIIFILELLDRFEQAGLDRILLVAELHDEPVFDAPADQWEQGAKIVEEVGLDLHRLILESFGVNVTVPIFSECKVLEKWK
jgi:DNA polymerase I-like protein with 3'-5' exonuclease and polymerase domains